MMEKLKAFIESSYMPEPNSGCWIWMRGWDGRGYGVVSDTNLRFNDRILEKVHRAAYRVFKGPIPEGLDLDHLCRLKCCVNPDHLEPVTRKENTRRGTALERATARQRNKTHCSEGHPFDEHNTYWDKRGHRNCRACHCVWNRQYNERRGVS